MKFDNFLIGLLLGLFVPLIGAYVFYIMLMDNTSITEFTNGLQDSYVFPRITALGAVFNLGMFLLLSNMGKEKTAKGVVFATILYALFAVFTKVL